VRVADVGRKPKRSKPSSEPLPGARIDAATESRIDTTQHRRDRRAFLRNKPRLEFLDLHLRRRQGSEAAEVAATQDPGELARGLGLVERNAADREQLT